MSAAKASVATSGELKDTIHLCHHTRVAISHHVGDIDKFLFAESGVVVEFHHLTVFALVERSGSQRLTIAEEVRVEHIFGDTLHLCRTASVVYGRVSERAIHIVLIHNHFRIALQVHLVEVLLEIGVEAEFAAVHQFQAGIFGFGEVRFSSCFIVEHIFAVGTFKEAYTALNGERHIFVVSHLRVSVHGDVFASEVDICEHIVHHRVAALTWAVEDIGVAGVEHFVHPVAVAIGAHEFKVLPSAIESSQSFPIFLCAVCHFGDAGNGGKERVSASDFGVRRVPSAGRSGHIGKGPLSDTCGTLVVVQSVEIEVAIAIAISIS